MSVVILGKDRTDGQTGQNKKLRWSRDGHGVERTTKTPYYDVRNANEMRMRMNAKGLQNRG